MLPQEERLDEIFRRVGASLWMLQLLETQSALYYLLRVKAERGMGFEEGTKMLIQQNKKTFGNTLRSIQESNVLPQELQSQLSMILKERNWLAHESNIQGYKAIESEQDTITFIERLEKIKSEALSLMKSLRELSEIYASSHGVTKEDMQLGKERSQKMWFEQGII